MDSNAAIKAGEEMGQFLGFVIIGIIVLFLYLRSEKNKKNK